MNLDSKRKRFRRTGSCLNQNMISRARYESKNLAIFRYFHNNKRLNVLRELLNKFAILKPDKGQVIGLINHDDYINSLCEIFDYSTKFKKLQRILQLQD